MVTIKKHRRLVNPHKAKKAPATKSRAPRAKRKAPKRNPGTLLTLGFVNPQRRSNVQKAKKKNGARRKKNPFVVFHAKKRNGGFKRRRRNPSNIVGSSTNMLKTGALALAGLVATRQLPQMVLGVKNAGWMGYLSNGVVALGSAAVATKFAGKAAGHAVMIGGGLYLVNRVLTEQFSPVGRVLQLAGVGDPQASATLGRIRPGSVYPPAYDDAGNLKLPPAFVQAMGRALPQPAAASRVSGVSRLSGAGRRF